MYAPLRSLVVAAAVVLSGPSALSAQQGVAADTSPTSRASASATPVADGPRLEVTSFAARSVEEPANATALQRRNSVGRPVALMVVGGAAIILGSVIDDAPGTLFMIGGTVALLYGLYLWLQ